MLAGTGTDAGGRLMCADMAGFVGVCGTDGGGNVGFYAKQIVHKSQATRWEGSAHPQPAQKSTH